LRNNYFIAFYVEKEKPLSDFFMSDGGPTIKTAPPGDSSRTRFLILVLLFSRVTQRRSSAIEKSSSKKSRLEAC